MRLAVLHNLPSRGALRAAGELARGLGRRHHVDVFTLSTAERELAAPALTPKSTYEFAPAAGFGRPFGMFDPLMRMRDLARLDRLYRLISRDIDRSGYDVVFVHPCRFTQAPLALTHLTRPTVYFCQEPPRALYETLATEPAPAGLVQRFRAWRHRPLASALADRLRAVDREACRRATVVAVNSRFSQGVVRRIYGVDPAICYLGVDPARFTPGGKERENLAVSVGALSPWKGFARVIDALGLVPAARRPALVLVGDRGEGGYPERLAERARGRDVALTIRSRIPDAELAGLYARARLTVYAPVREPFGLVPLESMASATPVVGVREGGVPETVEDGRTGLLARADPESLAAAVDALVSDPERACAYGAAGRRAVEERWTWELACERAEALLARAAGAT